MGERVILKNKEFQRSFTIILNYFLDKYSISFITLFLGPAPLISCRTTLIFFQGFFLVKNKIPIVTVQGKELYNDKGFDAILIQRFGGKYIFIDNKKNKTTLISSIEKEDFTHYFVGLVAREFHSLPDFISYNHLLFPNNKAIAKLAFKKFKQNKIVKKVSHIIPF